MTSKKSLYDLIIESVPALADDKDAFRAFVGTIMLQNDGDGDYIAKWEYPTALPDSLASYLR
jgi:hypothetical protein